MSSGGSDKREDDPEDLQPEVASAAERIASGDSVNWTGLESSAPDSATRDVLDQLKRVADIASFHQSWREGLSASAPAGAPAAWGPLTIVEEIGRGSSGRVFRARDPRLDRDVALKILEYGPATDSPLGRLVIEEGRHLAQIKHPNIVAIHGADRIDGRVGLEMELIEGRTLAEVIRVQGRLSAEEAALVGRDVCRALAAVHHAGLVHRDIKAQNVIRETGGRTVLMDLGAGKVAEAIASADIAGTPLYLAPEVLSGLPHTARSDLYSVGVLLYHLVTGAYPVTASSLDDLRAAHRSGSIRRLRDARPDLPERFIAVVERALEPDPARRFDSAGRFEAELSHTLGNGDRSSSVASSRRGPALTAVAILVALGASAAALWPAPDPAAAPAVSFDVEVDGHLTIPHGPGSREFALSPDGSMLVYSSMTASGRSDAHVMLRRLDDVAQGVITTPGGQPFFSPDGLRIGLYGRKLTASSLANGASVTLAERSAEGGGAFGPDGSVVFSSQGNLWRISEAGGEARQLTHFTPDEDRAAIRPQILPTGDILFTLRDRGGIGTRVAVLTRAGQVKTLIDDATSGKYLPPGYLVFVAGSPPWIAAVRFDVASLTVSGTAVQVQSLRPYTHWFDVSASGTLAYTLPEALDQELGPKLVWVDRETGQETALGVPLEPGAFQAYSLRLSPNGRHLAFTTPANPLIETADIALPGPLTVLDLHAGGKGMPLVAEPVHPLAWSRDGLRITYRTLAGAIAWRRIDGSGSEELLAVPHADLKSCNSGDWSPDGRVLMLGCGSPTGAEGHAHLLMLSFASVDVVGKTPVRAKLFLVEHGQGAPRFSDDGRWLAYSSNVPVGTQARVFVRAFPGPGLVEVVSPGLGRFPFWRGKELLYLSPYPTVVQIRTQPAFGVVRPPALPDRPAYDIVNAGRLTFQVSPDARRFLMLKMGNQRGGDYLTRITVVLNWADQVRRALEIPSR